MIFADPPYFLSNGGISMQSGKVVCVDEMGIGIKVNHLKKLWSLIVNGFLFAGRSFLKMELFGLVEHIIIIFSVATCLTELGFKY